MHVRKRIIPAYAGSTTLHSFTTSYGPGSSPHTRGAHRLSLHKLALKRIIPAYAGSTVVVPHFRAALGDHPRIRGEHLNSGAAHRVAQGSSPHTRGAHKNVFKAIEQTGIIPAYAGSTSLLLPLTPSSPDHPRIRGEHQTG